jgi:lipooligosaccharide transport system permease protein
MGTGTAPAIRVWERSMLQHRRVWRTSLLGSFLQPLLYLVGMGLGVGGLVDGTAGSPGLLGGVTYLAFIAPALLAASAMLVCSQDSLWPLLDGFLWSNSYRAMTATPLTPAQVAGGLSLWHATRALMTVVGVAVVLTFFADTRTWGLLAAVPAGVLTGLAFALPLTAWTASREGDASFPAILRFAIIPMFLFAGVFYPIDQLPSAFQPVAMVTPLWHGVQLCRGAVLGTLGIGEGTVHVAVLLAYVAGGWVLCRRAFTKRLAS